MVEETAYGMQAQVDFGEYNLRDNHGKRVKVFFFTMVLSRSRYKYVWFFIERFTVEIAMAHEKAYIFIGGITSRLKTPVLQKLYILDSTTISLF
jgi:transposase